jgi:hypothetical protein
VEDIMRTLDHSRLLSLATRVLGLILVLAAGLPAAASAASIGALAGIDLNGSLGEGRHTRYVPPLANPIYNESPYITTELRPFYLYQKIPGNFVSSGGQINLGAVQIRVALSERLGFIASKDGYADLDFDKVLKDDDGFANLAFGFKFAVLTHPEEERILSLGARYEAPTGNLGTAGISLQGDGDGFVDLFVTGATLFGKLGLQGSYGVNLAVDQDHDTSFFHFSLHGDYELFHNFFPLFEVNGFVPVDNGKRVPGNFDGIDLVNFGSTGRDTTVTAAGGVRYRFTDHVQIGTGFEAPMTDDEGTLMEWRVYADLVLSL